jgi:hypothetical protein
MTDPVRPQFQFYVPRCPGFEELPEDDKDVWPWICAHPATPSGRTVWTIYTCLVLQKAGVNCLIVRDFPTEGIVVSHRDFLPAAMLPRSNVYLVCLKPDRKQHSWAQAHVTQNPNDPLARSRHGGIVSHVPYWPQPSLIPRNPERGTRVENIAYVGRVLNQDPVLRTPDWQSEMAALGFRWSRVSLSRWHDYSEIDVTVSVRGFGDDHIVSAPTMSSDSKPPSKLTNSWLAGVPAIVGNESSFRAIRKSHLDFIVVTSKAELLDALNRLSRNPQLYQDMVDNGFLRSAEVSTEAVASIWRRLLDEDIASTYREWNDQTSVRKSLGSWMSYLRYWLSLGNISTAARGALHK